ncbi:MAG: YIP1 family protein [Gemmatimonadaceae bacterium]
MTSPENVMTAPAAADASVMDDILEIFYAPSKVFARRRDNPKFWAAFFILSILFAVGVWVMMRNYSDVLDAQMTRQMNAQMAKNPQFTPEMAERSRRIGQTIAPIGGIIVGVLSTLILGLAVWLVGKFFDSKADLQRGMVIATLASFPKVIDLIIAAVIALVAGTAGITNMMAATPSLARFAPATVSPAVLGLLSRISIGTVWATILVGIGMHVVGRTTKSKGYAAAVVIWVLATLLAVVGAIRQGA